jgi:hypothetical protein
MSALCHKQTSSLARRMALDKKCNVSLPTAWPCRKVQNVEKSERHSFSCCASRSRHRAVVWSAHVPSPSPSLSGIGRKQKRATLASTPWKGCWGLLFPTAKARYARNEAAKKPSHVHNFGLSDWPSPFVERKSSDEWRLEPFTVSSTTQRLLSKKTARMGDEGKAVGCVPPTALLFVALAQCSRVI